MPSHDDKTSQAYMLERVWPLAMFAAAALAMLNLLAAVVVALFGASLHPAFADGQAWVLFAAAGAAMLMQTFLMFLMYRNLWMRLHRGEAYLAGRGASLRLPITRALAHPSVRRRIRVVRHAGRHRRCGPPDLARARRSVVT